MEYFEKELLQSVVDFELVWYIYVDEVFALLPDTVNIQYFLVQLIFCCHRINTF